MKDMLGATRVGLRGAGQGAGRLCTSPVALALKPRVTLAQQKWGDVAQGRDRGHPACR